MTTPTTTVRRRAQRPTTATPAATPAAAVRPSVPASVFSRLEKPGTATHLKGVLFGPSKTGKTVASVSGKGKKLLVLTEPDGDLSIVGRKDVAVLKPANWKDMDEIIRELHGSEREHWEWVIFDSVTFMFEVIGAKDILKTLSENRDARRSYLNAGAAVNQLIHDAVALPTNVIFITQMRIDEADEESGEVPLDPEAGEYNWTLAVTPMVYKVLAPAVSFLGRTYKKVGYEGAQGKPRKKVSQYWTSFEDFGRSPAGARFPVPEQVQNLDLGKLLATVKGGE